jgi:hypothetical protein
MQVQNKQGFIQDSIRDKICNGIIEHNDQMCNGIIEHNDQMCNGIIEHNDQMCNGIIEHNDQMCNGIIEHNYDYSNENNKTFLDVKKWIVHPVIVVKPYEPNHTLHMNYYL